MLELVISRGAKDLIVLPLDHDVFRIGRAGTNDLSLPEPTVSRHQCEIFREQDRFYLKDHSTKGTLVDGEKTTQAEIRPGSRILFGTLSGTIRERPDTPLTTPTQKGGATRSLDTDRDQATDMVLTGSLSGKRTSIPLRGAVINVGIDPGNDLVVEDDFVSAFHCRLFERSGAWYIADLDSTNGTLVNGVRIGEAMLEPGSTITVGKTTLEVETTGESKQDDTFFGMVSRDTAMKEVFDLIRRAAPSDETILITGESGSGKELVAQACHQLSRRSNRHMVALNCAAISKDLLESELFGHEKGAFTGAQSKRRGLFEEAEGGTLFLDEIGELALDVQAKLLRALESGEIRRVGSNRSLEIDTRTIAATHRSLPERVHNGEFREDLYYRICVIEISLPPLRKRVSDIELLARHFLEQATHQTEPKTLGDSAIERLTKYPFPGNVRELKHIITRAAILSVQSRIEEEHLTFAPPTLADRVAESKIYLKGKTLKDIEIETLRQTLAAHDGNQKAAARVLGIARSTLIQKLEKYGIDAREL